jgi:putative CocE/NonD family hydrolase
MGGNMLQKIFAIVVLLLATSAVQAQELKLLHPLTADDATASASIRTLARDALAVYRDDDRQVDLNQRFRLQIVAGQPVDALASIKELRALRSFPDAAQRAGFLLAYQVYIEAQQRASASGMTFDAAFAETFRTHFEAFDDRTSEVAQFFFGAFLPGMQRDLEQALTAQAGRESIAMADALDLVRRYLLAEMYAAILSPAEVAIAADDARRYIIERDILVTTTDGAHIATHVIRPRSGSAKKPALLNFSIYADPQWKLVEAKHAAARGYAGVFAYTRGKGASPDAIVPYEHDGADATAVIDWISRQGWSDGRVGMFGGSYEGYTQWAAAKHRHPALKAIMPTASVAPGIDIPMEGGIFQSFVYRWIPHVTNNKTMDFEVNNDNARWERMQNDWYTSGKPYRDLDVIDGRPSPIFRRWLDHPTYDAYWQGMIPYRDEFAAIDIPVLHVSGYFDGCLLSTIHYFDALEKYRPKREQYLVLGPYDHVGTQARPAPVVQGYAIDPVAQIDIEALRYEWFDYVFKGAPRPALLADRINYQVMGANTWQHAPSLAAMGGKSARYYFGARDAEGRHALQAKKAGGRARIVQTVDLKERSLPADSGPPLSIRSELDAKNAIVLVGDPVAQTTELIGRFSGDLRFIANRKDFDLVVTLYELNQAGEYFELSWYLTRASLARDRSHRHLLKPGRRQRLVFTSARPVARQLQPGSRLVVTVGINKHPGAQINYGTGKDVSDETIADADAPLRIEWSGNSSIEIPLRR